MHNTIESNPTNLTDSIHIKLHNIFFNSGISKIIKFEESNL